MECSIWVFFTKKLENLGFFAKGHCSIKGQFKHFICILCTTLGGVCPHGLFVFLSLNTQTLSKSNTHNQFNGILCFSINLFKVQVPYLEGKVMLSLSIDDLNLCTLARNSVNINMYFPVLGRVDIFSM